jgi:putative membrane protein
MKKSDTFFTEEEKKKIEETVRSVEGCTIGEVAVMVVNSSDEYREATVLGSVLLGSGISLLLSEAFLNASLNYFILLSFLFFPLMWVLFNYLPALKTSFVGRGRLEEAVRERALRAFYEKGLYKTKANTGVLFFISLLEHKVWVLADKGIYEKIDQQTLNTYALTVSRGIKEGSACDALCQAINEAGKILAQHFPFTLGDTNELPDQIMTE